MLKVFLVEDEYVVREGIKNKIDWEKEGFIFCGEAADGEIAYKHIQSKQPDIIITDIKMPFMDGLELSRLIKNMLPQSKIIIISGHEDFSYAQEAVSIGVTEYILKPVSAAQLMKVVKKVSQQIIDERRERENFEKYKKEMEQNEEYIKRRFLEEIIEGRLSTASIIEKGKELGLEMSAEYYQIMILRYGIKNTEEGRSKGLLGLNKAINDLNSRFKNIIFFNRELEGNVLLIKGNTLDGIDATCRRYIQGIEKIFSSFTGIYYFGGIGISVSRLSSIADSYESAAMTFAHRFVLDKSTIVSSDEILDSTYKGDNTSITVLELGDLDLKKAEEFLRFGEAKDAQYFVDNFLSNISSTSRKSLLFMQYFIMNIYFVIINFLKEIGKIEALEERLFTEIDDIKTMLLDYQKVKDHLIDIFIVAIEQRDLIRTNPYYHIIEQAKKYIKENYTSENMSLNEVAGYVNISPSYFSTIFSRETGTTFMRYLTDLRMTKAKELLKCTNLPCSDIGIEVGYKDPHYFSYLFKKEHNCTPLQYRTMKE